MNDIRSEMKQYEEGLRRYITLTGMSAATLTPPGVPMFKRIIDLTTDFVAAIKAYDFAEALSAGGELFKEVGALWKIISGELPFTLATGPAKNEEDLALAECCLSIQEAKEALEGRIKSTVCSPVAGITPGEILAFIQILSVVLGKIRDWRKKRKEGA